MKKLIFITLLCCSVHTFAEQATNLFLSVPDTIFPFAEYNQRLYMLFSATDSTCVNNAFGSSTCLVARSADYVKAEVDGVVYEVFADSDSTWYFIQTVCAPVCCSVVTKYTNSWDRAQKVTSPLDAPFVKAEVKNGVIEYTDLTWQLRDEEENKQANK